MQNDSAYKIQSFVRGCLSRKRTKVGLRGKFDELRRGCRNDSTTEQKRILASQLLLFFRPDEDGDRIYWLCQSFVGDRLQVLQTVDHDETLAWTFLIARLLKAALHFLAESSANEKVAPLLRFNEIYSVGDSYGKNSVKIISTIYKYLMKEDYFGWVRVVGDSRIPPLLEETVKPPVPMAEAILSMVTRPLWVTVGTGNHNVASVK